MTTKTHKAPIASELAKAQSRIKQLEAENAALKSRPLALTKTPAPATPSPAIPCLPNGRVDSLAVTRARLRQKEADARTASLAISAKKPAGKIILNHSKYSV